MGARRDSERELGYSPLRRSIARSSLAEMRSTSALSARSSSTASMGAAAPSPAGSLWSRAALTALAAWWLLAVPAAHAAILGAALASTDPVLLRGLLRRRDISPTARQALQLESELNDVVLLPIVVVAIVLTGQHNLAAGTSFAKLGFGLFILGPGAGIAVGLIAVSALDLIRKRTGVRRDYESLYSLGVAFTAFAAAEAVHGSGFLAAFAAGLTIAALDVELCDCFIEYGGVTAEMLLLFTFVIFGSSLIWTGFSGVDTRTVIFAVFAILIRVPVYLLTLIGSNVDHHGRLLIAWFGPSGLSSLLLVLLPVFAGVPGSDRLFRVSALIVMISIVIHGASPMLLTRFGPKTEPVEPPAPPPQPLPEAAREFRSLPVMETAPSLGTQSITLEELDQLQKSGDPVVLLDVRTDRSRDTSDFQATGSVRIVPENVVAQAPLRTQSGHFALCGEGLSVGRDTGDSVSEQYTPFFPFEGGRIRKVEISTGDDAYLDLEQQLIAALARD